MKIIAVDNETISLQSLLSSIKNVAPCAEVQGFCNGSEAVSYIKKTPCDVAFLEIEMQEMNGIQIAKSLQAINPNVNIIFATKSQAHRDIAFDLHASGYLTKPITASGIKKELENLRRPVTPKKRIKIHAFGNFEVLFDGSPLIFKYQKSKEMLAYLVDRRGAMCSTGEIIAVLFEDGDNHKSYYHRIRSDMIETLTCCGCGSVIAQQRGMLGVRPDEIDCDYYDCINGKVPLSKLYYGEYMAQYSFAEITNAVLFAKTNNILK